MLKSKTISEFAGRWIVQPQGPVWYSYIHTVCIHIFIHSVWGLRAEFRVWHSGTETNYVMFNKVWRLPPFIHLLISPALSIFASPARMNYVRYMIVFDCRGRVVCKAFEAIPCMKKGVVFEKSPKVFRKESQSLS